MPVQYNLERRFENPDLLHTRWTALPLMTLWMWTHMHGRFAVIVQMIAYVNSAAFAC